MILPGNEAMKASDQTREALRLLRVPVLFVWALYLITQPFYVFPTGIPQPGDWLLLLLAPMAIAGWNGKMRKSILRCFKPLLWFTLYVVVIDYGWALYLGKFGVYGVQNMLLFPIYYIYNAVVFLVLVILYQRYGTAFLRLTLYLVFFTVLYLILTSFVYQRASMRGALFFSNPNQLGYYALLAACIIALVQRPLAFSTLHTSIALCGCGYLAAVSASRSALAGVAVLLILLVFSNLRVIILACAAAVLLTLVGGPVAKAIDASSHRMSVHRMPQYSFFEQRGYDRISANKEYLLFGAGEGDTGRFKETTIIGAAEIHSSAGTILFCYGIIGSILFLMFVWRLLKGAPYRAMVMLLPPLLYTFAHQGLRFTTLWVLLPLFLVLKDSGTLLTPSTPRKSNPNARPDTETVAVPGA